MKLRNFFKKKKEKKVDFVPDYKIISYSQEGEDIVLASFFETSLSQGYKGTYVDVGAHHPERFSNTKYFYDKGWRGINIDATPGSMIEFNKLRSDDINLEIGISPEEKDLIFYLFEEPALNTFCKYKAEDCIKWGYNLKEEKIIKVYTLSSILDKYLTQNNEIDILNIDAEGLDFEILKSNNWVNYAPKFILIEINELKNKDITDLNNFEIYEYMKNLNYTPVAKTLRTLFFRKNY